MGRIMAVNISEKKGTQKKNVHSAKLIEDWGIENDAHAGKWHRQVSLLSYEKIEDFKAKGAPVDEGAFGENLIVRGIDLKHLPVGTRLQCGDVLLEVTQIGKQCHSGCEIYKIMGDCIMPREGIFTKVLKGGVISEGDEINVVKRPMRAAVLTSSDSGYAGEREDVSGPTIRKILEENGYQVVHTILLPDDREMLAQEIHRLSTRKEHSMVTVDMGAISESLFESELFGHERGSFTDAYESRPGKFEAASGSSLFMDEIGNLPLAMQAKLLTVLQNRKITRIGSNKVIPVDIRLLSATNKNIQDMVDSGTFREDLLYRLNTIHLEIPPLRERGNDIHLFIDYFMQRYAAKYEKKDISLHEHALEKLCSYHWPGNIRELQHTIEKAVILCEGDVIRSKDIFVKQTWSPQFSTTVPNLEEVERQAIETAIRQNDGNLTATAEQLGISRQTLYNKIKRFKL